MHPPDKKHAALAWGAGAGARPALGACSNARRMSAYRLCGGWAAWAHARYFVLQCPLLSSLFAMLFHKQAKCCWRVQGQGRRRELGVLPAGRAHPADVVAGRPGRVRGILHRSALAADVAARVRAGGGGGAGALGGGAGRARSRADRSEPRLGRWQALAGAPSPVATSQCINLWRWCRCWHTSRWRQRFWLAASVAVQAVRAPKQTNLNPSWDLTSSCRCGIL